MTRVMRHEKIRLSAPPPPIPLKGAWGGHSNITQRGLCALGLRPSVRASPRIICAMFKCPPQRALPVRAANDSTRTL
jgi:hypothetical protein